MLNVTVMIENTDYYDRCNVMTDMVMIMTVVVVVLM